MQPDYFGPDRGGASEQRGIGGERDAQAGLDQVVAEAGGESGAGEPGGDVGEQVLGRENTIDRTYKYCFA